MTYTEFSNQFDILYDNAISGAPGVSEYEKSVFLTEAQEEYVKDNARLIELDDRTRRILEPITKPYYTATIDNNISNDNLGITNSHLITIPSDTWMILQESITNSGDVIKVEPIRHNNYNNIKENPFRRPNSRRVWRIEYSTTAGVSKVELITDDDTTITNYRNRYLIKPDPIITETLIGGLSIDGETATATCILGNQIHRQILNRSIELAKSAYLGDLQTQVALNQRNK